MKIDPARPAAPTNVICLPGRSPGDIASAPDSKLSRAALPSRLRALGAASGDEIDLTRVNVIRTSLASGTLRIDPGRIADGMLRRAGELLRCV